MGVEDSTHLEASSLSSEPWASVMVLPGFPPGGLAEGGSSPFTSRRPCVPACGPTLHLQSQRRCVSYLPQAYFHVSPLPLSFTFEDPHDSIGSTQMVQGSVQFSRSVVSDSLRPHEPQHARPPCPSPTPGVYSNSCPLSQWCHPTISSSVVPFSPGLQSFPASGSFQMSQLFTSGSQSIGASASASVLPMNIQDWFPLGWTGWISLQSKGLPRVSSDTTLQKHQFLGAQLSLWSNSHIHTWLLAMKNHSLD